MKSKNYIYWALFAMILIGSAVYCFYNLNDGVIFDWDESRHGVNAFEMIQSGDYLVHTYAGDVDYWNAKPPLSMWQIALGYKLFGYNTLGLRFFSAFYFVLIVLISMLFLKKHAGAIASISGGMIFAAVMPRFFHLFRTGDADAQTFFLIFLGCLSLFYAYYKSPKYLLGVGFCTSLVFLSKGMHCITLLLMFAFSLLLLRKVRKFKFFKEICLLYLPTLILPALAWGIARYNYDGFDFLSRMVFFDVVSRVRWAIEGHVGGYEFYFVGMHGVLGMVLFYGLLLVSLTGVVIGITKKNPLFVTVFGLVVLFPLVLFNIANTKIIWYMYPIMIGLTYLTAFALQQLLSFSKSKRIPGIVLAVVIASGLILAPTTFNTAAPDAAHNSSENIFALIPDDFNAEEMTYYTAGANGRGSWPSQSHTLYACFAGLKFADGGLNEFYKVYKEQPVLLVVEAAPDQKTTADRLELRLLAQNNKYRLYTWDYRGINQ